MAFCFTSHYTAMNRFPRSILKSINSFAVHELRPRTILGNLDTVKRLHPVNAKDCVGLLNSQDTYGTDGVLTFNSAYFNIKGLITDLPRPTGFIKYSRVRN